MVWLWIAIEPIEKVILDIRISFERSIYLLLNGSSELIRKYGKYPVSTDDDNDDDNDNDNDGTGYPSKHVISKIKKHHNHSSYEKSIIEQTIQYIKDRIESLITIFSIKKITVNYNTLKIG